MADVFYNGKSHKEIAMETGDDPRTVKKRILRGDDPYVSRPGGCQLYPYKGQMLPISKLAEIAGLTGNAIRVRLRTYSVEDAVEGRVNNKSRALKQYKWNNKLYTFQQLIEIRGISKSHLRERIRLMGMERAMSNEKLNRKKQNKSYIDKEKEQWGENLPQQVKFDRSKKCFRMNKFLENNRCIKYDICNWKCSGYEFKE